MSTCRSRAVTQTVTIGVGSDLAFVLVVAIVVAVVVVPGVADVASQNAKVAAGDEERTAVGRHRCRGHASCSFLWDVLTGQPPYHAFLAEEVLILAVPMTFPGCLEATC